MTARARGYIAVTLAACLWGLAGTAAKYLFADLSVPPFLLVQMRMGLAFVVLLITLAITAPHLLRIRSADAGFLAVWGVVGMAGVQFTYLFTIAKTNVATAIFLQYLSPILTALYAWLAGQRPGKLLLLCLGGATLGLFLLISGGGGNLLVSPIGLASGLASAFFMSFYTIYGARGVNRLSPWPLLCYALGFGTALWLLIDGGLLLSGRSVPGLSLLHSGVLWGFFAYMAILATIVPFGLYLIGLKSISPTQANLTGMLEPVVGGVAAYLVLGEALRPIQLLGGTFIVVAVLLLQYRERRATEA
ncbi:MAG: EamA family transporter [Mycobacterium leprae]